MNRSISLSLTLAVVLASQVALGGCNKKEDVNAPTDSSASAPATTSMGTASAPMDSISSASAVAGADSAASGAAMAASR
jgi:hypothetical protein